MSSKRVWIFTGNRAEYGLLHPLLLSLSLSADFDTTLVVGGEHLHNVESLAETEQLEGIHRIRLALRKDASHDVSSIISEHQIAITALLESTLVPPDAVLILGDRLEAMGVALAVFSLGISLVHLAAGDTTTGGCVDDRLRFAISSLATYAICFSDKSYHRIREQGLLDESHTLKTSSLAVDNALSVPSVSRESLCQDLGLDPQRPFLIFTQHPVGGEGDTTVAHFKASLDALSTLKDVDILATYPNQDAYGSALLKVIDASKAMHPQIRWVKHLGASRYQQALRHSVGMVGNSSSGLYEAVLYQKPCLNIGNRQAGRERASNVLDCDYGVEAVKKGLATLLYDASFHQEVKEAVSPFGQDASVPHIVAFLEDKL